MKTKLISAILLLLLADHSVAQTQLKPVQLSGSIKNLNMDTIAVVNTITKVVHKIGVDKTGAFKISLNLNEGYYNLSFQREYTGMYLKPGYDLKISADMENLDQSIAYAGAGANENNFLTKKYQITEDYLKVNPALAQGVLSEEDFLKQNTTVYDLRNALLEKTTAIDENFRYLEKNNIELEKRSDLFNYPMMMRYQMGKPDFKVSEKYPDAFKGLDVNNEKLIAIPNYSQVVLNYVYTKNNEKMVAGTVTDLGIGMLSTLDTVVKSEKIKAFMAVQIAEQLIEKTKSPEEFYTKFAALVPDENQRAPIREKYMAMKSLEKGMPSPDFSFADMTGKKYSLKDFKGKYIYVDVWATWCGPCKVEIPHLKKLESELHNKNIAFVSICTFDEMAKWEAMVKEKELSGTQLFAPRDNDFVKKYNIQGIPRFLLIDKEGKILSSDAKRPSDPTLKDELLSLP
ncbi:MAG: TlpA family protein disulfide reductase [Bacteroidetes bacterium]|nr:TlpA family protein disulfide reductase [Bacteroidota bacterium]